MMLSTTSSLGWLLPIPTGMWIITLLSTAMLSWWCYRRHGLPTWAMCTLASLRFLAISMIIIILAGPVIEKTVRNEIRDRVVILVDQSRSMTIRDTPSRDGALVARGSQIESIMSRSEVWNELGRGRIIEWFGFHDHPFSIDGPDGNSDPDPVDIPRVSGTGTDIIASINQLGLDDSINPNAGLIILSDGRSRSDSIRETATTLRSSGIPVHTIPIGPPDGGGDVAVESVVYPSTAYIGDSIPVVVDVSNRSGTGTGSDLILRDSDSGSILDRRTIEEDIDEYTLVGDSTVDGDVYWVVEITPLDDDPVPANNFRDLSIRVSDEPLRVLYIDGYPRWEYRYLKNLLIREESIVSSVMLLSADGDYAQEGDRPITRLPITTEEFRDFDVLVIGDIPSSTLTTEQQEIIEQLVVEGEMGILWIGGPYWTPVDWRGSTLESTIPFIPSVDPVRNEAPVHMIPTDESVQMGILRMDGGSDRSWPDEIADPSNPWSALQWFQVIDRNLVKPATQVLAESVELDSRSGVRHPLILIMQYGGGRSIYSATDETWRWRHGRGELLYERFWIPIIRSIVRSDRLGSGSIGFEFVPERVEMGQPQRIRLEVTDANLVEDLEDIIPVRIESDSGSRRSVELNRDSGGSGTWSSSWVPDEPGRWTVVPMDDSINSQTSRETTVFDRSGEMSDPSTNHAFLERISRQTGGTTVSPDDVSELLDIIPDRSIVSTTTIRDPLPGRWWMFCIPLLIFGVEWTGRRLFRLS